MKTNNTKLDTIGNKNPFRTPKGYFENFSEQLMNQLPQKENPEAKVINLWDRIKPWAYMAAMFVGLMFMVKIFVGEPTTDGVLTESVNKISVSEIEDFYAYYEDKMAYSDYEQELYDEELEYFND